VSEAGGGRRRDRILAFAAVVEAVTGLTILITPALVARLLLGVEGSSGAAVFERLFGIALLAIGLACWPGQKPAANGAAAVRAMLAYNLMIALYLGYVGAVEHLAGSLLWPAVAYHVIMIVLLFWTGRGPMTARA
jgi:hypothetical protein